MFSIFQSTTVSRIHRSIAPILGKLNVLSDHIVIAQQPPTLMFVMLPVHAFARNLGK